MIGSLRVVKSSRRIGLMSWEMNGTNCVWTREGKLFLVVERVFMGPREGFKILESKGFRWVDADEMPKDSIEVIP